MAYEINLNQLKNKYILNSLKEYLADEGIEFKSASPGNISFDDNNYSLILLKFGSKKRFYDFFVDKYIIGRYNHGNML